MEKLKILSVNCRNLDDQEFDELVTDLERFLLLSNQSPYLPLDVDSESWLGHFIRDYEQWSERNYGNERLNLDQCLQIEERVTTKNSHYSNILEADC